MNDQIDVTFIDLSGGDSLTFVQTSSDPRGFFAVGSEVQRVTRQLLTRLMTCALRTGSAVAVSPMHGAAFWTLFELGFARDARGYFWWPTDQPMMPEKPP